MSVTKIAELLGVHKSTISRELRRNGGVIDLECQRFYAEMTLLGQGPKLSACITIAPRPIVCYQLLMRQTSFLREFGKHVVAHGSDINTGKRKEARPFSHKHPIHLVFRSSRAKGAWNLLLPKNARRVERVLKTCSEAYGIKVYRFVNVGNHLHVLVKTEARQRLQARENLASFLRRFAGEVAFQITGAKKGAGKGGFWDRLVYSRIVSWGRQYDIISLYFTKNFFESVGLWTGTWHVEPFTTAELNGLLPGPT